MKNTLKLFTTNLAVLSLFLLNTGCTSWPAVCKAGLLDSSVKCKCHKLRFVAHQDAVSLASASTENASYIVMPDCDGQVLPIIVDVKNLKGCTIEK